MASQGLLGNTNLESGELHFTHGGPTLGFGMRNRIGRRVEPRPGSWHLFEVVVDPAGASNEEVLHTDSGSGYERRSEVTRKGTLQVILIFAKRFEDLVLRFGLKEGGGGAGPTSTCCRRAAPSPSTCTTSCGPAARSAGGGRTCTSPCRSRRSRTSTSRPGWTTSSTAFWTSLPPGFFLRDCGLRTIL